MKRRLPFRVTVLVWMVLWFTVWNAVRLWTAMAWRARLAEFAPVPGPLYIGLTGAFWLTAGILIVWSFWTAKPWTRTMIAGASLAYTAWYWADRLLLQQPHTNWPFLAVFNLLALILVFWALRSSFFSERGL
jgi:hypothetical protein